MATVRTPKKRRVAFFTPSKRKMSLKPEDEKARVQKSVKREKRNLKIDGLKKSQKYESSYDETHDDTENETYNETQEDTKTSEEIRNEGKSKGKAKEIKKDENNKVKSKAKGEKDVNKNKEKTEEHKKDDVFDKKRLALERKIELATGPLVSSLKKENSLLRSKVNGAELIGFSPVPENDTTFVFTYSAYGKFIKFRLKCCEDHSMDYEYIDSNIAGELPDFLKSELNFIESQMPKFFFNIMKATIGRDSVEED